MSRVLDHVTARVRDLDDVTISYLDHKKTERRGLFQFDSPVTDLNKKSGLNETRRILRRFLNKNSPISKCWFTY